MKETFEEGEDELALAECCNAGEEKDTLYGWIESSDSRSTDCSDIESVSQAETARDESSSVEMKLRQKKALLDFRCMVEDAILGNYILETPKSSDNNNNKNQKQNKNGTKQREISLWGIPLLPSKCHESTDFVLLKFLKARDFKVDEAFEMLQKTLIWRKDYKTDAIVEENLNLDRDLENVMFMNDVDKKGHPLFYAVYGAFKDKGLYKKVLGSEESRERFLRWKIQLMEKCATNISLKAGEEADSVLQITDFKNSPGPEMKELRSVIKKSFVLLSTNYPEFVYKNILINVPFWYYTSYLVSKKFMFPGAKRKIVVARRSKVTRTLLKYISPENLPVEYGGLRRPNDAEFLAEDTASELIIRGNSSGCITVPVFEGGVTMIWDFTVVGWDVTCKEEFIPDDEGSYRVLLRKYKEKRIGESIRNSFYIYEPGKLVITIDNTNLKKKKVYYRSKTKPYLPTYALSNR
ncbi:patellin-4-like [Euphorbia lathyris]|uniref:patellin-4-like n=1 Tax=Euphorbia lathyris TaxID=212925 RepID=UPI003313AA88